MKLFKKSGLEAQGDTIEMEIIQETVNYLLDSNNNNMTLNKIRYLICFLYNNDVYKDVELFMLIRNSDEEHQELIIDIINICQSKYGESCFALVEELAPQIIEKTEFMRGAYYESEQD